MSTPLNNNETPNGKEYKNELSQIIEEPKKKKTRHKHRKQSSNSENSESENSKEKEEKKNQLIMKDLIAENFVMLTLIGKGGFGQIYLSYDMRDNIEVSIKKEIKKTKKSPQLKTEAKIYQSLLNISSQDLTGAKALAQDEVQGVPHFYGMGELVDCYYLIIEFLGPNLIELFNFCGCHKFTISTVCLIALQMLNRIENLHKHHYIHRDIKPENFLIGTKDKSNVIFLIDFGLSKRYKNPKNHQHIPYREGRSLTGTARYVSINTHLGIEQSRRDDLESIGYVLIFFLKGSLPWQGLKNGGDKYQRIMEKKLQIPTEILCYGLSEEIIYYLNYCKSLRFEDRPDYDYLRGLFIKLLGTCNTQYGLTKSMLKFDWCFDDPATSIWQIYSKKGKGNQGNLNSSNNRDSFSKESPLMDKKNLDGDSLKGKLPNINEVKETFAKSNENNPDAIPDDDEENSSSESDKSLKFDDNKNDKEESVNSSAIDSDEKKSSIESDNSNNEKNKNKKRTKENNNDNNSEESETTIKEDFDGCKLNLNDINNEEVNNYVKNNFLIEAKEEDIDLYINKLLKSKGINRKNKNKEEEKSEKSEEKKSNSSSSKNSKENVSSKSSTPVLGTTGKIKLKDSLDIPNPDGKDRRKSVLRQSPEEIQQKLKDVNNLLGVEKDSTLIKNTYRNSKMISPDELKKIQDMANNETKSSFINKKKDKKKNKKNRASVSFKLDKDKKNDSDSSEVDNDSEEKKDIIIEEKLEEKSKTEPKMKKKKIFSENDLNKNFKSKQSFESQIKSANTNEIVKKSSKLSTLSNLTNNNNLEDPDINVSKEHLVKISKEPLSKRYLIIGDLGHGSYGQVKKVRHKQLNEIRAMKITSKKTATSKIEIDILRKISHPNITNIFEIYEDSRKYYIMMEFLEGGELFEAITSAGSFNELSAAKIMRQLLNAINYLHSNHIVHRDLKPENIMLTNEPKEGNYQIKLIDFGAATTFIPGKKISKFIGTSYYIAPEVLKENYDEKCDIWSCGVIFYILLCGYPPFNGNTNLDIYHNIRTKNPSFGGDEWEDISKDAIDLIKNMLNKNPNKRFSAEMCLNHKWFKLLEDSEKNKIKNYKNIQKNAITHMAQFVQENRFKKAVMQFISSQFDIQKEETDLKEIFKSLDTSGKGQLSRGVFTDKLIELYGENDGKDLADKIFSNLDLDGSGQISYDEFLSAMISSKKILTDERLEKAFKMFDKDNSGKLSVHEIISIFGGDEESWKKVIEQIDLNQDGEVDFNEFKTMMVTVDKNVGIKNNVKSKRTVTKPEGSF